MNSTHAKQQGCNRLNQLNNKNLAKWTLAWLVTMAVATFGPIYLWEGNRIYSFIFILINLAVGVGMIFAHKRILQGLDELQRKIQMDAMAITLGVTLVAGLAFSMLDIANVISFDAEISYLVFLMSITYGISIVIGKKRYS